MDVLKKLLIISIIFASFGASEGVIVSYNTTFSLQYAGDDAFEKLDETRIIFRAEPIDIRPGDSANLNFVVQNPTENDHLISIALIEVPPGFTVVDSEKEIKKHVPSNHTEQITFRLKASADAKPRTYWYGFDVVDQTLGEDLSTVVNTSKRLGTFHGVNVVETGITKTAGYEETEKTGQEEKENRLRGAALLIAAGLFVVLILLLKKRSER